MTVYLYIYLSDILVLQLFLMHCVQVPAAKQTFNILQLPSPRYLGIVNPDTFNGSGFGNQQVEYEFKRNFTFGQNEKHLMLKDL